jgi:hypothetical protein
MYSVLKYLYNFVSYLIELVLIYIKILKFMYRVAQKKVALFDLF